MQATLTCSYDLCAAHKLFNPSWDEGKNRAVYGKCADLHGHQYRIEIALTGLIPPDTGMLINGFEVDRIVGEKILQKADHKYLNDDIAFFQKHPPTAEWIAVWIFDEIKNAFPSGVALKRVKVYETPSLCAEYPE